MTKSKSNQLIPFIAITVWLSITVGTSWWSWNKYQSLTRSESPKTISPTAQLDIQSLTHATKLSE
jgi:hypothetical protein